MIDICDHQSIPNDINRSIWFVGLLYGNEHEPTITVFADTLEYIIYFDIR